MNGQAPDHGFRPTWETAAEIPAAALAALAQPPGAIVAIVATTDPDGSPRTAAFGSVRPVSAWELRLGCNRGHDTYANLLRDGRVMIAVFSPPDVAVGIRGTARVIKERMDALPTDAVVEIRVEAVKNDLLPVAPITSGITYRLSEETATTVAAYNAEVEAAGRRG